MRQVVRVESLGIGVALTVSLILLPRFLACSHEGSCLSRHLPDVTQSIRGIGCGSRSLYRLLRCLSNGRPEDSLDWVLRRLECDAASTVRCSRWFKMLDGSPGLSVACSHFFIASCAVFRRSFVIARSHSSPSNSDRNACPLIDQTSWHLERFGENRPISSSKQALLILLPASFRSHIAPECFIRRYCEHLRL